MATYMIWEGFMDKVNAKMRTVQKKCAKYGVEFTYRETGKDEYRTFKQKNDDGTTEEIKLRYVEVEAEGKAQINGWEWLARIEHTEKGNLIHSATDVTVPVKYYESGCYCEHCNTNRFRKNLHLVRNMETGEIKQVGETCLADYTHGMSASGIAFYQSLFTGLEEEEERVPSCGGYGWGKRKYYDPDEVTRFMSEAIRHFGFVPKHDESEYYEGVSKQATAYRVEDFLAVAHGEKSHFTYRMDDYYKIKEEMEKIGFNAERPETVKEAHDALAWIAEQDDSRSSYIHNLKLVCSMSQVNSWHFGILASLLPTWNKSLVREAERKAKEAVEINSKHIGSIGERITFDVFSTQVVTSWETEYGMMWLVKFVSTDGNVFMWRASSLHALPDDFGLIKKITGTVKNHDEFRGVKQTFINRCKVA